MFYINEVLVHIDGLFQKRKDSPTSVKMGRRTPAPPRGGTTLWQPLTTTIPQKWGEIPFTTTSVTGILTQCTVCSTYCTLIIDHSGIFDTPCIGKTRTFCITNSTNSSLIPSIVAWTPMFRCCNFSTMSTMVYINVLYFAVTVDPLILLLHGRVHPHPRCGTPTPPPLLA